MRELLSPGMLGLLVVFLILIGWAWRLRREAKARDTATFQRWATRDTPRLGYIERVALANGAHSSPWPDERTLTSAQCGTVLSHIEMLEALATQRAAKIEELEAAIATLQAAQ